MCRGYALIYFFLLCSISQAGATPRYLSDIISVTNFSPYYKINQNITQQKVAILDTGFAGYEKEVGKTLPQDLVFHKSSLEKGDNTEQHGLAMAQILYRLTTNDTKQAQFAPVLHLYEIQGFTDFENAVADAIKNNINIIVYSQVWEYGGNGDGKGFINAVVNKATDAGILWLNAAGNFGDTILNAPIVFTNDDWVKLPDANNSVAIRCEIDTKLTKQKECILRLVLSWNDFSDDVNVGSDKDLDLVLTDDTLNIVARSSLVQSKDPGNQPGYSKYPREIITIPVKPGLYYARVKKRSDNFTKDDQLHITASGDFIFMPSHSKGESILNPADNPSVITVGASDSEKSSSSQKLHKPEVLLDSLFSVSATEHYKGSSNSTAIFAAAVTMMKSLKPELDRKKILSIVNSTTPAEQDHSGIGLQLRDLGFGFTGPGCFIPVQIINTPLPQIKRFLDKGGMLVQTTTGIKIMTDFDPIITMPAIARHFPNDILVTTSQGAGYGIFNRSQQADIAARYPTMIEVLQLPWNQKICGQEVKHNSGFQLPDPSKL